MDRLLRKRLLTFGEYRRKVKGRPGPFLFAMECPDRKLYYCGFQHSVDPLDPQFPLLERFWKEYLAAAAGNERVLLVEGGTRVLQPDRSRAIVESGGEGGLATYLAHRDGVTRIESPEPDSRYLFNRLREKFPEEQVRYAYLARRVSMWHRFAKRPDLDSYMRGSKLLVKLKIDPSRKNLERIHKKLFGRAFDEDDVRFFARITDPGTGDTVVNRILRLDSTLRDVHVVKRIKKHWDGGRALFVVFGASHAIMQKPALEAVLCRTCPGGKCRVVQHP